MGFYLNFTDVDESVSECGLDDYEKWDLIVKNNNEVELNDFIEEILKLVEHSVNHWSILFF